MRHALAAEFGRCRKRAPAGFPELGVRFPEAFGTKVNVLIFSGLALFAISFAVNFLARLILTRAGERRAS